MPKLLQERSQLFCRLEDAIRQNDELQINCIVDSLRLRLGAAGQSRIQALTSFFNQITNLLIPFHMKYLIWIASKDLDIFSRDAKAENMADVAQFAHC